MRKALLAVVLLALAGCGGTTDYPSTGAPTAAVPDPPALEAVVTEQPLPTRITIPAIGAESTLVGLGTNPDGSMTVPPVEQPMQASWFEPGVRPGAIGPAVVLAHVSGRPPGASKSVPGLFAKLATLPVGADINIERADGSVLTFRVGRVETHSKNDFPTISVFGDTASSDLRLITCGGIFDPSARSYKSNVIVWASLVSEV